MLRICFLLLLQGIAIAGTLTVVEEKKPDNTKLPLIKFSGIWIRGNATDAEKSCPIGFRYAFSPTPSESAVTYHKDFHATLVKKAKNQGNRIIDHIGGHDYLPNSATSGAYVMACAVKYEISEQGILPSGHRGSFGEIGFDLIICDFSDRSVVVAIPCRLVMQDHGDKNERHLEQLYEKHLPDVFAQLAEAQWNPGLFLKTAGVTHSKVSLPTSFKEGEAPEDMVGCPKIILDKHEMISSQIAASRLYDILGIPVQPLSLGEEAVFYGLRENLVNAPDLRTKQILEKINGNGFVLKKPQYELTLSGAYFRTQKAGQANYVSMYRLTIKDDQGREIFNDTDQAASDGIPIRSANDPILWQYQADASSRMFEKFALEIKNESKKKNGNQLIKQMWNDLNDARGNH